MNIVVREDGKTYERHERIREVVYYTPWGRETQVDIIVEYRECIVDQAEGKHKGLSPYKPWTGLLSGSRGPLDEREPAGAGFFRLSVR